MRKTNELDVSLADDRGPSSQNLVELLTEQDVGCIEERPNLIHKTHISDRTHRTITRKMSPLLLGLIALLVGCSMVGAAISVIVSNNPDPSTATVSVEKALTLSKSDSDIENLGLWAQDYPYLDDTIAPAVGAIFDVNITARSTAILPNVVFYFKITKTTDGTTPTLIRTTDVVVKEYQANISTSHWTQLEFESYGDYMLGTFIVWDLGTTGVAVTNGWSDVFTFMVQFTTLGTYDFEWYADSINSPVPGTPVHP